MLPKSNGTNATPRGTQDKSKMPIKTISLIVTYFQTLKLKKLKNNITIPKMPNSYMNVPIKDQILSDSVTLSKIVPHWF